MKEIARKLKVKDKGEYEDLRKRIKDLIREGIIGEDKSGRVRYVHRRVSSSVGERTSRRLTGVLQVTRRGTGFVRVDVSDQEVFIPPRFMRTALDGDRVQVSLFVGRSGRRGRNGEEKPEGEIEKVVERARTTLVGTLKRNRKLTFVVPDNARLGRDITIADGSDEDRKASEGDKVVVGLSPWTDEHLNPEGTVLEVLGRAGDARVEVVGVAKSMDLPMAFAGNVLAETASMPAAIDDEEIARRLDLRSRVCFTIDPEDAKDFDDAVSWERLPDGSVRLGVHIADVSHYVREGTALDKEALKRGTSVYLVNEVIPMLPERLSNDLCSLRPGVDRLTFSVFMDLDDSGTVSDYSIRKSVIHSARRFSYEEVQGILERKRGELAEILLPLSRLTATLTKRRNKNGSIDFATAEAKFRFDENGLPSAIIRKDRLDAHRLVEECMLLANKTVAKHIGHLKNDGERYPFIYRVHDSPDPQRLMDLANFVKGFGFSLNAKNGVTSRDLQRLLEKVKGSEVETLISEVALRSMAKAVYSDKNIGHYGLAFKNYTHFTSPIRRYPDLVVHRLLHEYDRGVSGERRLELSRMMPDICLQSSNMERRAVEAERE